jgi:peptide/nickel transport system permease protein
VPAVLIVITVWSCNLLADAIRDVSGEAGRAFINARRAGVAPKLAPTKAGA